MELVFLPEAELDIDRLYEFLILENPLAAKEAMLAIDRGSQMLEEFPELGKLMEDFSNKRELFIPYGKSVYVLRYCIDTENKKIVVLRVWHGREKRKEK